MTQADRPRFLAALGALAVATGTPLDEARSRAYWMALDDLPIEAIERAVRSALRSARFFPRPVELREACGDIPPAGRAAIAFEAVRRAIREQGAYRSVAFDDPLVNATVRNLGGWPRLCGQTKDELDKWTRKDFERVYAALAAVPALEPQATAYLTGIHECNAAADGRAYSVAPVTVRCGLPSQSHAQAPQIAPGEAKAIGPVRGEAERSSRNQAQARALIRDVVKSKTLDETDW